MEGISPKPLAIYAVPLLAAGLVGAGVGAFTASPDGNPDVAHEVLETLELQTGQDLELLNVESSEGMYMADIETNSDRVRTYYVSPTGEMFLPEDRAMDTDRVRKVARQKIELGDCLRRKDVVLYGNLSRRSTKLQIQYIGERYLEGIYGDVSNTSVLQAAVQQGVQKTPAFLYNDSVLSGVRSVTEISEFASCGHNMSTQS